MQPGPIPAPTPLKALRGNPGKRALNKAEPKPARADPADVPANLPPAALEIWHEYAPELARLGLLTKLDRRHLGRACRLEAQAMSLWAEAEASSVYESRNNGRQLVPEFVGALKAFEAADKIWYRFGVGSPSERSRMHAGAGEEPPASRWQDLVT